MQAGSDASELIAVLGNLPAWRLEDLYESPDSEALGRHLRWLEVECAAFSSQYKGRLCGLSGEGLFRSIHRYESIIRQERRLALYAGLRYQKNTQDPARAKFLSDIGTRLTEITKPLVFFKLELNCIEDKTLVGHFDECAGLRHYRVWLDTVRALRPHQLSAEVEAYAHDFRPVQEEAWTRLFSETVSSLSFEVDGESNSLEPTLSILLEPDRGRRQRAHRAIGEVLEENKGLFARITNTLLQSRLIDNRWRSLPTPQAARHLADDIEPEIVQALRDSVVDAYPRISHRYYALKARWMGLENLESWDRIAPLPGQGGQIFSWEEAREIVESAFAEFSPLLVELAAPFFDAGWMDAAVTPGKAPGAFSASGPTDVHPYIFLNYQGKARDVTTLAHELGHGIHQSLASVQGELMSGAPLTFAETASVFGEMLVFRSLLEKETDPASRKSLLVGKAGDMIHTVIRQISFYEFESRLHEARRSGELLPEEISSIWIDAVGESLGPSVRLDDGYRYFWCYVPHFIHSPFYVYAYAFGDALVNALYGLYRKDGVGFADKYLEMLRAGGSCRHPELLAPFGLDLRDPSFWKIGLDLIEEIIDEAEAIAV